MNLSHYFSNHPKQKEIVLFLSKFCVLLTIVSYLGTLGYLFILKDWIDFIPTFCSPLLAFVLVEVIRHFYSRPRPFETMQFTPLIDHETGKSFPSKHATSALVIALALYPLFPIFGILMIFNALLVGMTRILSGIHYPSDVLGGYVLATICNYLVRFLFFIILGG